MNHEELAALMSHRRTVAPGEVIFLEGQPADNAYVILKGEVQVTVDDAHGNTVVINRMPAGELFGEIALVEGTGLRTATAVSKEGCELLEIEKGVFAKRLAGADPLLRFVIAHLAKRVVMWTDRVRTA
ncbi:MAG: cyclic nucleotide-binding domain-containing protein [Rhodospirillaceae bacterium]|nr:cyclic nucleotide-binding domain-containing protein [Rhodospirillaceae bacterium]